MAVNNVSILDDYKKNNQTSGTGSGAGAQQSTAPKTTAPASTAGVGIGYDKNTDYSLAIQDAANRGDYFTAAQLEQQRNAKIDGEGITAYQKTNQYSAYLPGGSAYAAGATGEKYTYENPYQEEIDRILGQLANREFTYDPNNDQAQALRQRYTEAGQQAMQDTLAQVSARTGGLASSYAGTAAQQQYNNYMLGLDDSLAALEQQAYQNWLTEQDALRSDLSLLASLGAQGENSYWNALNYDTALRQYQDDIAYRNWKQDLTERQQNLTEQQYQDSLTETDRQYAYDTVMGILQTGNMPSTELLTASGISSADAQLLANYYRQAMLGTVSSGGGGGRSSGGSSSGSSGSGSSEGSFDDMLNSLYSDAAKSANPKAYISQNYKKYGFNSSTGLSDGFDDWQENPATSMPVESIVSQLRNLIGRGRAEDAQTVVERYWPTLDEQGKERLRTVLGEYGYVYYE